MSYIGNPPVNGVFRKLDTIAASFNGSTTSFNLTSGGAPVFPGLTTNLIISLGGIIQEPNTAYTISGSTISFTAAPPAGTSFWGIQLGDVGLAQTPNQNAMTTQVFTATAGQTTFTVNGGYTVGQLQVLRNGVQLVVGVDVTATNGTTFVLTNPATAGDTIVSIAYVSFIVANAVAKSGDTMTGPLTLPSGGLTVGGGQLAVDSSGYVTMPNNPVFKATYTAGQTFTGGAWAKPANFNSIITNIGSCYSSATGRFTAPKAGTYMFTVGGIISTASTGSERYAIGIAKNGTLTGPCGGGQFSAGDTPAAMNCFIHTANAGDYFEVNMYSPITCSLNYGDPYGFYFCGVFLG